MQKVLAMKSDGTLSYCTCPPELRGRGRCNHVDHQGENETNEDFIKRVSIFMSPTPENKTVKELSTELIQNNILSFNQDPDWSEVITPDILSRYLRLGTTVFDGKIIQKTEINEDGDEVDHLYVVGKFGDFEFSENSDDPDLKPCDFGCIPHIREDGTFTIKGVEYRCLPVVSKDKVGYGQGYSRNGDPTIWLYQENGNLGISIPVNGDECEIFKRKYPKEFIEEAINKDMSKEELASRLGGYSVEEAKLIRKKSENPETLSKEEKKMLKKIEDSEKEAAKLKLLFSSLDNKYIAERCPEYGNGSWMSSLSANFSPDVVNDLSYRRVYTYSDQVKKELVDQLYRMGGTLRLSMIEKNSNGEFVPKKGAKPVLYQKNNTENIRTNLLGRSNVQMAETLNPLSAYSQSHKVSLVGIEGYNKDNCPDRLRMVGESLKGIADPLDQSSGKGIGLSIFLKGSDVQGGVIRRTSKPCYSLSDFVPYRNHNNPNRVSMATSQMRQAMQLVEGEDPRILGDQVSDRAWASISGAKMGRNLKIVYLPGEKEWEDSAEISESAAKKLAATKRFSFGRDARFRDGSRVKAGTKVGGKTVKYDGVLRETPTGFDMDVVVPFTPGNKIAGRFGNKCTVGRIIPDDQMPKVWNSETKTFEPAEIIMSPLSIGKRGNIGAIMETQSGDLSPEAAIPVKLPDGRTVKVNNGTQFIMRLNQVSQEKNHANAGELTESREAKARFGEMESILMSTTEGRRRILKYLKNQGTDEVSRLDSLLKAIGVKKL